MSVEGLATYLAIDRLHAIASGADLPDRMTGSALLADISGFTPLTEALVGSLGPQRGAEELAKLVNEIYTDLVSRVRHFGGSVVCFIGDALIACYPEDTGLRALACALQMQRAMERFRAFPAPHGGRVSLAMKAAVTIGPMRRFLIGAPASRRVDVLAGATIDRLTEAEHAAQRGEVIASPEVARRLSTKLLLSAWRGACGVVEGLRDNVEPAPWPELSGSAVSPDALRSFVHGPVHARVLSGEGEFLAELRPVSVLFVQFGGIDYDSDDDAGVKLDEYTRWVQGVAGRYGGHVLLVTTADKGSHLYVVFGALEAHEDDRQRAVATGLRLLEPPSELAFITGVRIGISVGRARVGAYGGANRRTYGALGEVVNLAARLMQAAPAGEIRCSEAIYHAAKDRWTFDALPAIRLKGMEQPQRVYRPHPRERSRMETEEARLIGRATELDIVRDVLRDVEGGKRRGVLLEGEAGIGKSRLTEEIRRIALAEGFLCLSGEADSIEQHTAYRTWRALLLGLLEIDSGDPDELRGLVIERLEALDPSALERAPLLNDILEVGIPETSQTSGYASDVRQDSLAALVGELLVRRAAESPLMLILEDAHWLDSLSWDLLVSVARTLANQPALVLVTHRPCPEPVPQELGTLRTMAGIQRLPLGSLSPDETVAVVADRLGVPPSAVPESVVDLLGDRAEGNPFFAMELVGALCDQGLLAVEGESCVATIDVDAMRARVPDTLEGVVLARLGQLPAEEQLTVKVASVIGRSFLLRTLHTVRPGSIGLDELRLQLEHTSRRRLTALEADDPEPSFGFQHAVTQHVAYDTLLYEQRRELHRCVANWVEKAHRDRLPPHYPLLALHWNRAENAEKECMYCRLAGEQAVKRYAISEAEMYLSRAAELVGQLDAEDSERTIDILRRRARVYGLLGRVDDERKDLKQLLARCDASGEAACRGEILLLWSDFHRRCGSFDDARSDGERALTASREAASTSGEALALTHIGNALEGLGDFLKARDVVGNALERFAAAGDSAGQAASLKALGTISARLGDLSEAMDRFNEARDLYARLEDRKGEADILGNLGALNYYLGDYEMCIEYTEQAQPLFQEMGNRIGSAKCLTNLGNSYSALGAFSEALTCHRQALELYEQLEDVNGRADSLCNVGLAHQALGVGGQPGIAMQAREENGELRAALEAGEHSLRLYREIGSQRGEMLAEFNLGTTYLCMGDVAFGKPHVRRALDLSCEMEIETSIRWALSALARAQLLLDETAAACRFSTEAIERLGEQASPEAAEIRFTHYRVFVAMGNVEEARPHLEAAHRLVIEQAEAIRDPAHRERFLASYADILTAREKDVAAPTD